MFKQICKQFVVLLVAVWVGGATAGQITATDIVTVDGKNWAQVDLFTNLSWNDINAVCPAGICGDGETLNGHTMTGWAWASLDDVNALFNHYLIAAGLSGYDLLGPGGDTFAKVGSTWAKAFFADGWRATDIDPGLVPTDPNWTSLHTTGWTSSSRNASEGSIAGVAENCDFCASDSMTTLYGLAKPLSESWFGGWFYQSASPAEVPVPATFSLIALGLAGMGVVRRTRKR